MVDTAMFRALDEHQDRMAKLVRIEGEHIVFSFDPPYDVNLGHVDTEAKLLAWVAMLTSKPWMTLDAMGRFILLACDYHEIELPFP